VMTPRVDGSLSSHLDLRQGLGLIGGLGVQRYA
jgi:hypothetical protein